MTEDITDRLEDAPPDAAAVMESLRSIGYDFADAVADIIDNSIAAGAQNISIECDYDCAEPYISILDDGCGMSRDELSIAMRLGSKNPLSERSETDLGRFGMGLKLASLSQCSRLTVLTRKNGIASGSCWDLDVVRKTDAWKTILVDIADVKGMQAESLNAMDSGTLVIWTNFDVIEKSSKSLSDGLRDSLSETKKRLEMVFHRFLDPRGDARDIKLTINGGQLKARDPFLTRNTMTQKKVDEPFIYHNKRVVVKGYVLPHINQMSPEERDSIGVDGRRTLQGFYVYRNKRMIMRGGTWFNMASRGSRLNDLARVMIDLPNDLDIEWKVNINKSSVDAPQDFKDQLRPVITSVLESSKKVYTHRGYVRKNDDDLFIRRDCKGRITYDINRNHPIVRILLDNPDRDVSHDASLLISMIEHSMPYDGIRADFENPLGEEGLSEEEKNAYLDFALFAINSGMRTMEQIVKQTPYSNYPELVDAIREEMKE